MKKILFLSIFCMVFAYYNNNALEVSNYTITSPKWPSESDGFKIIHLSDLQSKSYGDHQVPLLSKIASLEPDLIVMTGDLIDRRHYKKEPALDLMKGCVEIAPTAFVTGNHEIWHGSSESLMTELQALGVIVLNNDSVCLSQSEMSPYLFGIGDRADFINQTEYVNMLNQLTQDEDILESNKVTPYKILLSHRPEQMDVYSDCAFDLVLSGHSHGGQIRLPFVGGLFAPHQGFLPKYDGGLYTEGNTHMIVSRGLGNSVMPIRVFNRPEIAVITLFSEKE